MFDGVIFRSCSNIHVRRSEFHLVIFKPNFGHIELVKITRLPLRKTISLYMMQAFLIRFIVISAGAIKERDTLHTFNF